jgi:hypothetical protein
MLPSSAVRIWQRPATSAKSLAERVAALEAKVGSKTIEEQFREQAALIDRLFIYRFDEFDRKWEEKLERTLAQKLDQKLARVQPDIAAMKDDIKTILARLM